MVLVGMVLIGGIQRIGQVASTLVPFMAVSYVLVGLVVLAINATEIPAAFSMVFSDAFSPAAAEGGFAGAAVWAAIRFGVARGIFSNEAGLGSAPIAHAAAQTNNPVKQGMVAMLGTFIDTIIVCSITGLVIITSGAWTSGETGAALTSLAFESGLPIKMAVLLTQAGLKSKAVSNCRDDGRVIILTFDFPPVFIFNGKLAAQKRAEVEVEHLSSVEAMTRAEKDKAGLRLRIAIGANSVVVERKTVIPVSGAQAEFPLINTGIDQLDPCRSARSGAEGVGKAPVFGHLPINVEERKAVGFLQAGKNARADSKREVRAELLDIAEQPAPFQAV